MNRSVKKLLRTVQSEFPSLKGAKDVVYRRVRKGFSIPHESDFRALQSLPLDDAGIFVDVGANHGQSIESIRLFRPDATIISYEANPGLAAQLQARYRGSPRVTIHARGLADVRGSFPLYVPAYKGFTYDGLASLDRSAAENWISAETVFGFDASRLSVREVLCEVDTLDAESLAPCFIKIDVQGLEYQVLAGARETLRRYRPILLVEDYRRDARCVALAEQLGYQEYNFDTGHLLPGAPVQSANSFLIAKS